MLLHVYLEYAASEGKYAFLPRQPAGRYTKTAKEHCKCRCRRNDKVWVDPTGPMGSLLKRIQTPSLAERAAQGREVGFAIIVVGVIDNIWTCAAQIAKAVRKQAANSGNPESSNPLVKSNGW